MSKTKAKAKTNTVTTAQCNAAIKAMVASFASSGVDAHAAAMLAVTRAMPSEKGGHGDATACQRLYEALEGTGKILGPKRQAAFMAWLKEYTPIRRNDKTKNFGIIDAKAKFYVEFDRDGMESNPWTDFQGPAKAKSRLDSEKLAAKAGKLITKTLNDAFENELFDGEFDGEMVLGALREAIAGWTPPTA